MRVADLLVEAVELPEHEARRLAQIALETDLTGVISNEEVSMAAVARYRQLVARRLAGEPLQYLEGTAQFGPITVVSDPRALIPRPETERLWELAIDLIADVEEPVIIDLCTGSGNLALALREHFSNARVIGTDLSSDAVSLATENAMRLELDADFLLGDLFGPLDPELRRTVDLIVSNPPYIAEEEWASLPVDVRDHEPFLALVAGPEGTEILERIAREACDWLRPGGRVICEIGETQADTCRRLFADYSPQILTDLAGRDRFVLGWAPEAEKLH